MRILWLKAGLLLPLDKGGKLRTWHLMRHLAARHDDHVPVVRRPASHGRRTRRDARGRARRAHRAAHRPAPRARPRFYADAAAPPRRPACPTRSPSTVRRDYADTRQRAARTAAGSTCRLRLPAAGREPAGRAALPVVLFTHNVEAEIWRRHAENATAPLQRCSPAQQWRRMLRFEEQRARPLRPRAGGVGRRPRARSSGSIPARPRRPSPRRADRRRHDVLRAQAPPTRHAARTSSSPARWTGCRTKTPCCTSCREILPLHSRGGAGARRSSIVGRAPTPAVQPPRRPTHGVEVTGRVDDVRPHMAARPRSTSCRCASAAARA